MIHIYLFNMDISLIIAIIYLKTSIHITETRFEGKMCQNFSIGLSFCFIVCRIRNFAKYTQNS